MVEDKKRVMLSGFGTIGASNMTKRTKSRNPEW